MTCQMFQNYGLPGPAIAVSSSDDEGEIDGGCRISAWKNNLKSCDVVHGEGILRILTETADIRERLILPLGNQEILKPFMFFEEILWIDCVIVLFGDFCKDTQE